FGGEVRPADHREYGYAEVELCGDDPLLSGLVGPNETLKVWMSHGDRVERLPPGFQVIAKTRNAPLAGIADSERRIYGLQFHPEVTHTERGFEILSRFVRDICGCPPVWTPKNIIAEHIRSEEHTSELQSRENLVCRLLLEKKKRSTDIC